MASKREIEALRDVADKARKLDVLFGYGPNGEETDTVIRTRQTAKDLWEALQRLEAAKVRPVRFVTAKIALLTVVCLVYGAVDWVKEKYLNLKYR